MDSAILWDVGTMAPLSCAKNESAVCVTVALRRFSGPWTMLISHCGHSQAGDGWRTQP